MIPKCRIYCYETQEMIVARDYRELAELFSGLDADDSLYSDPMQSTWLFDINGKEIFEGDVVKVHHFTENFSENGGFYEGEEELIGIIEYGYTDYEVQNIGKVYPPRWGLKTNFEWLDFSSLYGIHEESFEVVGNSYQNQELLEEENK